MELNFIYDEFGNLILENDNFMVGDIIVINKSKEYEITFIDESTNLAYAELNGFYSNETFKSRYLTNIFIFSGIFILLLISLFFSLILQRKKNKNKINKIKSSKQKSK